MSNQTTVSNVARQIYCEIGIKMDALTKDIGQLLMSIESFEINPYLKDQLYPIQQIENICLSIKTLQLARDIVNKTKYDIINRNQTAFDNCEREKINE